MELQNRFKVLETDCGIDEDFRKVVKVVRHADSRFCRKRHAVRKSKLSDRTLELMRERCENKQTTDDQQALTKHIRKAVWRELRCSNTRLIKEAMDITKPSF